MIGTVIKVAVDKRLLALLLISMIVIVVVAFVVIRNETGGRRRSWNSRGLARRAASFRGDVHDGSRVKTGYGVVESKSLIGTTIKYTFECSS